MTSHQTRIWATFSGSWGFISCLMHSIPWCLRARALEVRATCHHIRLAVSFVSDESYLLPLAVAFASAADLVDYVVDDALQVVGGAPVPFLAGVVVVYGGEGAAGVVDGLDGGVGVEGEVGVG